MQVFEKAVIDSPTVSDDLLPRPSQRISSDPFSTFSASSRVALLGNPSARKRTRVRMCQGGDVKKRFRVLPLVDGEFHFATTSRESRIEGGVNENHNFFFRRKMGCAGIPGLTRLNTSLDIRSILCKSIYKYILSRVCVYTIQYVWRCEGQ